MHGAVASLVSRALLKQTHSLIESLYKIGTAEVVNSLLSRTSFASCIRF